MVRVEASFVKMSIPVDTTADLLAGICLCDPHRQRVRKLDHSLHVRPIFEHLLDLSLAESVAEEFFERRLLGKANCGETEGNAESEKRSTVHCRISSG